jgi:hypothetical protein
MRGGGVAGSQPMSTAVHNAHGAQTNLGDLSPYLTYGYMSQQFERLSFYLLRRNSGIFEVGRYYATYFPFFDSARKIGILCIGEGVCSDLRASSQVLGDLQSRVKNTEYI